MKENNKESAYSRSLTFFPKRKVSMENALHEKKSNNDFNKFFNLKKLSLQSDNKIIDYSETIKKLLGQIKSKPKKTSSINNSILNDSYSNSNSSEIGDDKESEENKEDKNIKNIKNINTNNYKTVPKLNRVLTHDSRNKKFNFKKSNNNLDVNKNNNKTHYKLEKSPTLSIKDFYKKRDSLVLKFHRYFFQDGDIDNIDTIIKYNINKIKINYNIYDAENNETNEDNSENNIENENNIFNIKNQVINIMDKFDEAFTKEKRDLLIIAIKDLNNFSKKYKFSYVEQLTLNWIQYLEDKNNLSRSLKYFGYYNQIREIMDKMLKEIKKKVDLIIVSREKRNKHSDEKKENEAENKINIINKKEINKEELLKSKEIVPIKLDIDIQNRLSLEEIEDIIKNLEKGDFLNIDDKNKSISNKKKLLKTNFNNRNDNELEAFAYPFKEEDSFCCIF